MATAVAQRKDVKEYTYLWEGVDRNNRNVRGEMKGASETVVTTNLRRQGIRITKLRRQTFRGGKRVTERDITFFTRQLATMLRAGVPLLQSFEIVARGHSNARFARLMMDIKGRVETGSSLSQAFREYPSHFDALYCNLVHAGETAGMLDGILERLATYKEKILAIKSKIKSALFYPISVVVVAIAVNAPVSDWSSCVTPCWTRSPIVITRMSSNAESCESSFFPMLRVTRRRKKNVTVARRTISIRASPASNSEGPPHGVPRAEAR